MRSLQDFKKISILEVRGYCYGWHFIRLLMPTSSFPRGPLLAMPHFATPAMRLGG